VTNAVHFLVMHHPLPTKGSRAKARNTRRGKRKLLCGFLLFWRRLKFKKGDTVMTLQQGSQGDLVRQLQTALHDAGFGPDTIDLLQVTIETGLKGSLTC